MVRKYLLVALVGLSLSIVPNAFAHDPSKHVGKSIMGEVISVEGNDVVVKSDKEEVKVVLNEKTKFEKDDAQATRAELNKGSNVHVFGTRLATGEVVAKEVVISKDHQHHE